MIMPSLTNQVRFYPHYTPKNSSFKKSITASFTIFVEVRRTRSGRAVRPPAPVKTPRKTRKKMVLVEVEVSEEEEDANDNQKDTSTEQTMSEVETNVNNETAESNQLDSSNQEDSMSNQVETMEDSNSGLINEDSSAQSGPFTEQNLEEVHTENQTEDSLQTENSTIDVPEEKSNDATIDISILNTDSQTQHKPEEKDAVEESSDVTFTAAFESSKEVKDDEPMEVDEAGTGNHEENVEDVKEETKENKMEEVSKEETEEENETKKEKTV